MSRAKDVDIVNTLKAAQLAQNREREFPLHVGFNCDIQAEPKVDVGTKDD